MNHGKIDMAQAERFDVMVDFSIYPVGTEVTLINEFGAASTSKVMRFVVAREGTEESRIPPKLPTSGRCRGLRQPWSASSGSCAAKRRWMG